MHICIYISPTYIFITFHSRVPMFVINIYAGVIIDYRIYPSTNGWQDLTREFPGNPCDNDLSLNTKINNSTANARPLPRTNDHHSEINYSGYRKIFHSRLPPPHFPIIFIVQNLLQSLLPIRFLKTVVKEENCNRAFVLWDLTRPEQVISSCLWWQQMLHDERITTSPICAPNAKLISVSSNYLSWIVYDNRCFSIGCLKF